MAAKTFREQIEEARVAHDARAIEEQGQREQEALYEARGDLAHDLKKWLSKFLPADFEEQIQIAEDGLSIDAGLRGIARKRFYLAIDGVVLTMSRRTEHSYPHLSVAAVCPRCRQLYGDETYGQPATSLVGIAYGLERLKTAKHLCQDQWEAEEARKEEQRSARAETETARRKTPEARLAEAVQAMIDAAIAEREAVQ